MSEEDLNTASSGDDSSEASEYEAVAQLGEGGMGTVYKAYQARLDRYVALKVMSPDAGSEHSFAERFRREAKAMALLTHPNVVAVYDFGESDDGMLFLAMECVEGTSLREIMISEGQIDPLWVTDCALQICAGLKYAHDHEIIHRDIKPANIMVSVEGVVKILDFGLAKMVGRSKTDVSLTASNVAMGTLDYIAPEQLEGSASVDHRADIYSFGVMLYEMYTGKLPRGAFFAPSVARDSLHPDVDDAVLRAIQSKPEDRFQEIGEMQAALEKVREGILERTAMVTVRPKQLIVPQTSSVAVRAARATKPPETQPPSIGTRIRMRHAEERKKRRLSWVAVAAVALAGVVAWAILRPSEPEVPDRAGVEVKSMGLDEPGGRELESRAMVEVARGEQLGVNEAPTPDARELPAISPDMMARFFPLTREGESGKVVALRRTDGVRKDDGAGAVPEGLDGVVELEVGYRYSGDDAGRPRGHGVALKEDGTVVCWGVNDSGQCDVPAGLADVVAISSQVAHSLALKGDGTVVAWGANESGQCEVPEGLDGVIAISAGGRLSLALRADGRVVAWGDQGGRPKDLSDVKAIEAGQGHALALRNDGTVSAWGQNAWGECDVPSGLDDVVAIAAQGQLSVAVRRDGSVVAWGDERQSGFRDGLEAQEGFEELILGGASGAAFLQEDGRWVFAGNRLDPARLESETAGWHELGIGADHVVGIVPAGAEAMVAGGPGTEAGSPETPEKEATDGGSMVAVDDPRFLELEERFRGRLAIVVDEPHSKAVEKLHGSYRKALEKELPKVTAAANLDDAVWLKAELERIKSLETQPTGEHPGMSESLRRLRDAYGKGLGDIEGQKGEQMQKELAVYDKALEALQGALTREDRLEEAIRIEAYREEIIDRLSPVANPERVRWARYVRIRLPADTPEDRRALRLAEVEVMMRGKNIATRGKASQSSIFEDTWLGNLAIDGNTSGVADEASISRTKSEVEPWWEVDLKHEYPVESVVVHGMVSAAEGLKGFVVELLDEERDVVFTRADNPGQREPVEIAMGGPVLEPGADLIAGLAAKEIGAITFEPPVPAGDLSPADFENPRFGQSIENTLGMVLMGIEPGLFVMGSPSGEAGREAGDWEQQHEVALTHGFWMGKYEVTRAQWKQLMSSEWISGHDDNMKPRGDDYPITHLFISQAREFCEKLTEAERRRGTIPPNFRYRVPTQAQWEYACRAGTTGPTYGKLEEIAWPLAEPTKAILHQPVGQKKANAWGLHDMIGNVMELCMDVPGGYYPERAINPHEPDYFWGYDEEFTDTFLLVGTGERAAAHLWSRVNPGDSGTIVYPTGHYGLRVVLVPDRSIPPDLAGMIPELLKEVEERRWGAAKTRIDHAIDVAEAEVFPKVKNDASIIRELIAYGEEVAAGKGVFPPSSKKDEATGNVYMLIPVALPWKEALEFAEIFGGTLATITSEKELDFVVSSYERTKVPLWLGAEGRSTWKWNTGERWKFSPWADKQPDRIQEARRYGIYCKPGEEGTWGDLDMEEALPFLIEWQAEVDS